MKKSVIGFLSVVVLMVCLFAYKVYDNYSVREEKIEHVMSFQKVAYEAYTMLVSGNYKEAVELYDKAINIYDKDAKTLLDYSRALAYLHKDKKSVEMFEKAYLVADYKNEDVLVQLASMNHKIQNYKKSEQYYKEAIERFRPKYRYLEKIILSLEEQDKTDEAMSYFAYIQEKDPKYFEDKDSFSKFISLYTKDIEAIDLLPKYDSVDDIDELFTLGKEYEAKGLDDKALKAYDKILLLEPTHQKANLHVAELLLRYKDYIYAKVHIEQLTSKDYDTYFKLGRVNHQLKKYNEAIKNYEEALQYKQTSIVYKNLAACSFNSGDMKKVIKYLGLLEKKDPRMAYNFEYATLVSTGKEMSKQDKLKYQVINTWYDLKDFLTKEESKNDT